MIIATAADEAHLPPLREILPDDNRLGLLEILEFRNAAMFEGIADALNLVAENSAANNEIADSLDRIADTLDKLHDLLASVTGKGLVNPTNGPLRQGRYIRTGDGADSFFQDGK
jgi:hypothetical protein